MSHATSHTKRPRHAPPHRELAVDGQVQNVLDADGVDLERELRVALANGGQQRGEVHDVRDAALEHDARETVLVGDVAINERPAAGKVLAHAHIAR